MKNILVIGNGFDIAHGLYTRYIDFYNFCNAIKKVNDKSIEIRLSINEELLKNGFMKSIANIINNKNRINTDTLEKMINICKNNYWLNNIEERNLSNDPHWCDIEGVIADEISKLLFVANNFNKSTSRLNKTLNENSEIAEMYDKVIEQSGTDSWKILVYKFKEKLLSDLNDLTCMLEIYLSKFLNTKLKTYKLFEILNIDYIINFNYTDTYNNLYKKNIPTHFIHGKIRDSDKNSMNMVFGIGDRINEIDNNYEFIEFQKYYQRIIYKTGNYYAKWLDNDEIMNIFIFGHSVNEVDGDIIKRLITREHTNIYIYYYNQEALNSIVANLAKILGKDIIIDYTNKNKIVFLSNSISITNDRVKECRETTEILKEIYRSYEHNETIAAEYAKGLVNLAEKLEGEECKEITERLKDIYKSHRNNKDIATAYAKRLVNFTAEQEVEECKETTKLLKELYERHRHNEDIATAYAKGLANLASKLEVEECKKIIEVLKELCISHKHNEAIAKEYAKRLTSLLLNQKDKKAMG